MGSKEFEFYELDQRNDQENVELLLDLLETYEYSGYEALFAEYSELLENGTLEDDIDESFSNWFDYLESILSKHLGKQGLELWIESGTLYIGDTLFQAIEEDWECWNRVKLNTFDNDIMDINSSWFEIVILPALA